MKKMIAILLCAVLSVSLCACGGGETQTETTSAPTTEAQPTQTQPVETTESKQSPVDIARSCIDKPVSELYALIGEPESSDYASSCMGDGEDGLLIYDGFVVYTYREGDSETVYDVE